MFADKMKKMLLTSVPTFRLHEKQEERGARQTLQAKKLKEDIRSDYER